MFDTSSGQEAVVITGIHALFYTKRPNEMYAFLRDVLELPWIDAGNGRLFFAAPPTDLAVHETEEDSGHELYLMCDDIHAVVKRLAQRGVPSTGISDRGWGLVTELKLPSGDVIGIYEPRHPRPHKTRKARKVRAATKPKKKSPARPRPKA
ncbi:MAG: VOC family protein, partial [Vulcanimicrobiaceae bacterium]